MAKKQYRDKNFFSFFLLLALSFLTLVAINSVLGKNSSLDVKAGAPTCIIMVPNKYTVSAPDTYFKQKSVINGGVIYGQTGTKYAAVQRGQEVAFKAMCYGFSDKSKFYWNFGNNCQNWTEGQFYFGSAAQRTAEGANTFYNNGDFTVKMYAKEGTKAATASITVGVYDKKTLNGFNQQIIGAGQSSAPVDNKEFLATALVGGNDPVLAGYEEQMCKLKGENLLSTDNVYRDLSFWKSDLVNGIEVKKTKYANQSFYLEGEAGVRETTTCGYVNRFWDDPASLLRQKINKVVSLLKGSVNQGSKATLSVQNQTVTYRERSEYVKYEGCVVPIQ